MLAMTIHPREVCFVYRFHACFAAVALGTLARFPSDDVAVLLLVLGWHAAMVAWLFLYCPPPPQPPSHSLRLLRDAYRFATVAGALQVLPDWFLVGTLGTLRFPPRGLHRIGDAVTLHMAGMWAIPFFLVLVVSLYSMQQRNLENVAAKGDRRKVAGGAADPDGCALLESAVASTAVFGAAEFLLCRVDLWHCTGLVRRRLWGHVAAYVLVAEALLGPILLREFCSVLRDDGHGGAAAPSLAQMIPAAATVMFSYTGALAISHLFVEGSF